MNITKISPVNVEFGYSKYNLPLNKYMVYHRYDNVYAFSKPPMRETFSHINHNQKVFHPYVYVYVYYKNILLF